MAENLTVEEVSIEFKGTVKEFQSSNGQLIDILEKLQTQLNNTTKSMSMFNKATQEAGKSSKGIKDTGKSATTSALKIGTLGASAAMAAKKIYGMVTASSDFISSQLSFNAVFGETNESLAEAKRFAEEYSNALYLDEKEVISAMSTFKLLTRNMGITNEASTKMSKNLTQLAYDLSAFTNSIINIEVMKIININNASGF